MTRNMPASRETPVQTLLATCAGSTAPMITPEDADQPRWPWQRKREVNTRDGHVISTARGALRDPLEDRDYRRPLSGQPVKGGQSPGHTTEGADAVEGSQDRAVPQPTSEAKGADNLAALTQAPRSFPYQALFSYYEKFPNVVIQTGAVKGRSMFCVAANTPYDLQLPNGTVMVRLKSETAADFYAGFESTAERPTAANTAVGTGQSQEAAILNPDGWYFVKGRNSISVLSTSDGCIINAECVINTD